MEIRPNEVCDIGCREEVGVSEALPGRVVVTLWVTGLKGWASSTWSAHDALGESSSISISASRATLVEYSSVDDEVE